MNKRTSAAVTALVVMTLAGCGAQTDGRHHHPPKPHPTHRPSPRPTLSPTISPTISPTVVPTVTPSGSPYPVACHITPDLRPDPACNPSETNPAVTQATIVTTICVRGWTATVRPPVAYTDRLKVLGIKAYGYTNTSTASYEEDHLLPLDLGGNPTDPRNLWPEPRTGMAGRTAADKDADEASAVQLVCAGKISLDAERAVFLAKWGPVAAAPAKATDRDDS